MRAAQEKSFRPQLRAIEQARSALRAAERTLSSPAVHEEQVRGLERARGECWKLRFVDATQCRRLLLLLAIAADQLQVLDAVQGVLAASIVHELEHSALVHARCAVAAMIRSHLRESSALLDALEGALRGPAA